MHNDQPPWLREIDHTGDIGLQVTADSLEQLFARAAYGMFWVLTDLEAVRPRETASVEVEASDREALMVKWLSELNYIHTTSNWLFHAFEVEHLSDTRLQAQCRGEPVDRARHTIYTEIKAVTFHGLQITQDEDGWHVQIIFDM